jgi:two-component system, LytTR family, response regulator
MDMHSQIIRTIIVDDEKPSSEALANYIEEYCPDLKIVATCKSIKIAYNAIMEHNPDLLFLDIEMPRGNGFDLLRMFKTINFSVVFVTAFSNYAINAFRVSATDFLLKPVKISELIEAVRKVQSTMMSKSYQNLSALLENMESPTGAVRKIIIPNLKGFTVINPSDIILCEADGYCTNFFLSGESKKSSSYHLKFYEDMLPASKFLRVHKSYIINTDHVIGYTNQGEIMLTDGITCGLSDSRKPAFLKAFKHFR